MKTKSLLGVVLGLAIISSGFYYIASEFISADKTTLSLLSPTSFYKPGDVFDVQVLLTTKQEVYGVDAFINYDPAFLEVVEVPVGDSVFDDYPGSFKGNGVHELGNTRDSNVATAEGDILESVKGLDLTISSTTAKGK
jgi:hypothetical protein